MDKQDRLLTIFGLRTGPSAGRSWRAGLSLLAIVAAYASAGGLGDAPALRLAGAAIFLTAAVAFFWSLFWHLD